MKMFGDLYEALSCNLINGTDEKKVKELEKSIMENGWQGAPILYMDDILITGSHRTQALTNLEERYYDFTEKEMKQWKELEKQDVTFDVSNIIQNEEDDMDYDNLKKYFKGTEVEKWKNDLLEW